MGTAKFSFRDSQDSPGRPARGPRLWGASPAGRTAVTSVGPPSRGAPRPASELSCQASLSASGSPQALRGPGDLTHLRAPLHPARRSRRGSSPAPSHPPGSGRCVDPAAYLLALSARAPREPAQAQAPHIRVPGDAHSLRGPGSRSLTPTSGDGRRRSATPRPPVSWDDSVGHLGTASGALACCAALCCDATRRDAPLLPLTAARPGSQR